MQNSIGFKDILTKEASKTHTPIVQKLKSNRGKMRFFIDNNITLYYYYYDKNKKVVTEIEIAPSLYK